MSMIHLMIPFLDKKKSIIYEEIQFSTFLLYAQEICLDILYNHIIISV